MEARFIFIFVCLLVIGPLLVFTQEDAATVAFYNKQCQQIHGNSSAVQYLPQSTSNYGCRFQCRYTGLLGQKKTSTDSLPNLLPCRSSSTNACINKKCYQKLCVDKCLQATGTAPNGRKGIKRLVGIRQGTFFNRNQNYYCQTSFTLPLTTAIEVPMGTECTLPNQDAPPPPVTTTPYPGSQAISGKQGPDQVSGNPNKQQLNATAVCLGITKGDLTKMKIHQNGCYFTCKRFQNLNFNKILQPNGMSCGNQATCLNGSCVLNSCETICKTTNPAGMLRKIKQDSKTLALKCYYVGSSQSVPGISMPTNNCFVATS